MKIRQLKPKLYIPLNYKTPQDYEFQFNKGNRLVQCEWLRNAR